MTDVGQKIAQSSLLRSMTGMPTPGQACACLQYHIKIADQCFEPVEGAAGVDKINGNRLRLVAIERNR